MSGKHDRHAHKKSDLNSRDSTDDSDNYKHVLKERHSRNDEKNKRKDRDRNSDLKQPSSHSHKNKKSSSPHGSSHRKEESPPSKSKERTDGSNHHRSRKQQNSDANESYEELSRRKRKLESELRALDLEEAAAKDTGNKKTRREKSDSSKKKELPEIKVKKETVSDEEKKSKSKIQQAIIKTEKDKNKNQASRSSEDEKGWGKSHQDSKTTTANNKEKPNFAVSGKLAEETNTYNGVVIKYNEPSEARKPKRRWRLYPFKGDSDLPFIPIHRQSAYLFGRTRLIADIPIDHPSCSKQHAVLQFRLVPYKREDGTTGRRVRPYIIDLESSNGTYVNNNKVEPRRYVELVEKDVVKFGYSSREYVLLHEESKYSVEDDDVLDLSDKSE